MDLLFVAKHHRLWAPGGARHHLDALASQQQACPSLGSLPSDDMAGLANSEYRWLHQS